jgi:hypothetical protein
MTQATHTQGPWWRDDEGFIAAGSGETYVTIADGDCSDLDIDEREANKRLIAAAPDLLAVLEWWQAQMRDDNCDDMGKLLEDMSAKAHAAITKAKGAQHD